MITLAQQDTLFASAQGGIATVTVCGLLGTSATSNDFKVLHAGPVGSTPALLCAETALTRIIKTAFVANSEPTAVTVSFFVNGSNPENRITTLAIPANGSASYSNGEWSVYDADGILQVVGKQGPKGDAGTNGTTPTVTVGPTTVVVPSSAPSVADADAGPNVDLRFSLPRARNIAVGSTATSAPGGPASVTPTTDSNGDVSLAFVIPRGDTGPQGPAVPLSSDPPQSVAATSSAGVSTSASRADHAHAHGDQSGGTLHAAATTSTAGFMSAADKTKLDGVAASATNTPLASTAPATVGTANSVGVGTSAARADHVHAHGAQTDATLHAVATTSANGFMSASDKTKLDGVAANATNTPLASTAPATVGTANAVGVGTTAARADHVHAHGDQAGGTLHALATDALAGFMSANQFRQMAAFFGRTTFFAVDYGTLTDGSDTGTVSGAQATANRQAIQAAIDAASSSVGKKPGGIVMLPPGTFHIDATLTINTSAVILTGCGAYGNTDDPGTPQTGVGTSLFWNNTASPATTPMIDVTSIQGSTNPAIKNSGVVGMSLQCAGNVGIGLRVKSIHWGQFRDIYIINPTASGLRTECFVTTTELGEAADVTKCDFERIRVRLLEVSGTAVGFSLNGASNANTSNSTFRNIAVSCQGAQIALDIGNTDSNSFYDIRVNQSNGGTVQPVRLRGGSAAGLESRGNVFYFLAAGGSSTGIRGVYSEGTEIAGVTAPAKNNVVFGYSIENGEPLPIIGTGSELQYEVAGGPFNNKPTLTNSTVTAETIVARWQVPENYFQPGQIANLSFFGQVSGTATLIYRIRVGTAGTTADALACTFATSAAGVANAHTSVDAYITCLTAGAAGTVTGAGRAQLAAAILGPATAAFAAATANTTARLFVSLSVQQSAAQTLTARSGALVRER